MLCLSYDGRYPKVHLDRHCEAQWEQTSEHRCAIFDIHNIMTHVCPQGCYKRYKPSNFLRDCKRSGLDFRFRLLKFKSFAKVLLEGLFSKERIQ